ncbi:MAG: hypothetical protein K2M48_04975 [Clostridiales bacterium]|nr:hypothetical protein [Clostridiales bacterium]
MKKKSFVAILLSAVMAIAATFALVGCGDNDGGNGDGGDKHAADTSFVGSISVQSYESANDAAAAFLTEELDGAATSTTFVSYEKSADLTEEEIAELNLGEDFEFTVEDIDSAENGVVSYTESTSAVNESAAGAKTARVVIIKIGSVYWYYVPMFKDGEVLTNSYMDNILDFTKYANVTETVVSKSVVSAGGQMAETSITITTKIANDKIYFKQVAPNPYTNQKETTEYYFVVTEEGLLMYDKVGSEWDSSYSGFDSLDEFLEAAFKYDASYFVKTKSGFKMNSEKLTQFLRDVLDNIGQGYTISSVSANYYVKDARLDSAESNVKMKMTYQGQTINGTATVTTTYTDYGTTVVNLPFEI